jgi:uncharacterized cupin superfamily protein
MTGVPESRLEQTEHGLVPEGEGWFVVNAREAVWRTAPGRSAVCDFEGEPQFSQLGVNLSVLAPGQSIGMYHWEADQEDFLVLSGEALLIAEGEERPLRQWDFVHCPPGTAHVIVGAGERPCVVLMVGARGAGSDLVFPASQTAAKYGASVDEDTTDRSVAYAGWTRPEPRAFPWPPAG